MRIAWTPVLGGAVLTVGGIFLLGYGWREVVGGGAGVTTSGLAALAAGVLLTLLGLLMVAMPLLVPVLYRLYGEQAFTARGGTCPVVAKCQRCGEFNFRGRPHCKQCASPLVWELQPAADAN